MGEQWGKMGKIQFLQISPNFLHFNPSLRISPHFSPFSPISPHFPPFSPIFFCLGYIVGTFVGTLPATGAGYF